MGRTGYLWSGRLIAWIDEGVLTCALAVAELSPFCEPDKLGLENPPVNPPTFREPPDPPATPDPPDPPSPAGLKAWTAAEGTAGKLLLQKYA